MAVDPVAHDMPHFPARTTSTHRPAALAAATAVLAFAGPAVAPAHAAPSAKASAAASVRIVSPRAGATITGSARLTAVAPRKAGVLSFRVDAGRKRTAKRRGRSTRDGGVLNTTTLRTGRHTLSVRVKVRGKVVTKRVRFSVSKPTRTLRATGTKPGRGKPTKGTVTPVPDAPTAPAPSAPPAAGDTIFAEDFEGGDLSRWELVQAVSLDRARPAPAPPGHSGNAGRFEVRNGDHVNGETSSRAEVAWGGDMFSEGETNTFSWSTYFTPDFTVENGWATTTQFKGDGSGGPPLELGVIGNQFMLSAGEQLNYAHLFDTDLVRGQWLDFTVRVHWSRDPSKGTVDMWYRGQQVVTGYKMATLLPDRDNYFKFGLYRDPGIVQTGVLYHDNLRITQG